jgi:hypothetical protein
MRVAKQTKRRYRNQGTGKGNGARGVHRIGPVKVNTLDFPISTNSRSTNGFALAAIVFVVALIAVLLAGCQSSHLNSPGHVHHPIYEALSQQEFKEARWRSDEDVLPVRAWLRHGVGGRAESPPMPLLAVFEADGAPWRGDGYFPPENPTPDRAVGAEIAITLARAYPKAPILYIARPCQFIDPASSGFERHCADNHLWTSGRFGGRVVQEASALIDAVQRGSLGTANSALIDSGASDSAPTDSSFTGGAPVPVLVGYSGGGTLALLVALYRSDIACLTTFASPLDLQAWARVLRLTPLADSLDPADQISGLAKIPRLGFWFGSADSLVPIQAAGRLAQMNAHRGALHIVEGLGHRPVDAWVAGARDRLRLSCAPLFD